MSQGEPKRVEHAKLRINTLTDRANYLLNGLGAAASFLVIAHAAGPIAAGAILAVSYRVTKEATNAANKRMTGEFRSSPSSDLPAGSEELPEEIADMAEEKFGMKKPPSLFVFGKNPDRYKKLKGYREQFSDIYCTYANAAAFGSRSFGILTSTSLLEILEDKEEQTVLGHELAHIKAKHPDRAMNFATLSRATQFTGLANYANIMLSSWAGVGASVAGAVGAYGSYRLLHAVGYRLKDPNETPFVLKTMNRFATAGILGVSALQGRYDVLAAWAGAKILTEATKLIALRDARCCEYQADRLGAEATGHYTALASALRKLEKFNKNARSGSRPPETETMIDEKTERSQQKVDDFIAALGEPFKTHPTTAHRGKRLLKMAARHEKAPELAAA